MEKTETVSGKNETGMRWKTSPGPGGREKRRQDRKCNGKREDVFDSQHHVPPSCSLTLTSMMLERVSEARRAPILRGQPEMSFRTESEHLGKGDVRKEMLMLSCSWGGGGFLMEPLVASEYLD